ncbi:hypothetical protein [Tropicimonas isoalkanivorans]|uniref:Type IV pilus biogenesis protein PilP n=1 Tax=Tropicimonas isoalkanivorans TaxID=441112 RepID=A0A1I1LRC9_9RHOB|nr:hypothetical protein [Tropicimonas isoalkanivorans]SFC72010.1 hypothetical protein SAMN04488094_108104 [Tropicimonas isoalkanivorans]
MTPTFALALDFDGIALLYRAPAGDGWRVVGSTELDVPDLGNKLGELRARGEALADDMPFATKLVLPESQVLFIEVPAGDPQGRSDAQRAAKALEGRTPYTLDELAYDWARVGNTLRIAAVARETLEEAEDFASLHRFNPVSYVAVPPEGAFPGEPFFGPTGQSAQWLPPGETPYRDVNPVRVVNTLNAAVEDAESGEAFDATALSTDWVETVDAESVTHAVEEPVKDVAAIEPADVAVTTSSPETRVLAVSDVAEPVVEVSTEPQRVETGSDALDQTDVPLSESVSTEAVEAPEPSDRPTPAVPIQHEADAEDTSDAPDIGERPEDDPEQAPPLKFPPEAVAEAPRAPIRSRPASPVAASKTPGYPSVSAGSAPVSGPVSEPRWTPPGVKPAPKPAKQGDDTEVAALAATAAASLEREPRWGRSGSAELTTVFGARTPPAKRGRGKVIGLAVGAASLAGLVALWTLVLGEPQQDGIATDPAREIARTESAYLDPVAQISPPPAESTSEAPTAVAQPPEATESAGTAPRQPELDSETASLPANEPSLNDTAPPELMADAPEEVPLDAGRPPEGNATADVAPDPSVAASAVADPQAQQTGPLDPSEARAAYDATGIWQRAPDTGYLPENDTIDELEIAAIDPEVVNQDAYALPDSLAELDRRPRPPTTPRHPDSKAEIGADGLVVPTKEGVLSPGGIMIHAGSPFIIPPRRAEPSEETLAALSPDRALAGFQPKRRPGDLVETTERATLGGRTRTELAGMRPLRRPQSAQELAAELTASQRMADEQTEDAQQPGTESAASGAPQTLQEAALAIDLETATRRAIPASPMPRLRPANISQIADRAKRNEEADRQRILAAAQVAQVEAEVRARAEAQARAEAEAQARARQAAADAAAASAAAETSSKVGPAVPSRYAARPTGTTPAAVARRATLERAIALNKVSLIGVYGSSNQRRALVRLPSGKYLKVQVGDRLDGGRVAAIGNNELQYSKGGRSVTLKMPKG